MCTQVVPGVMVNQKLCDLYEAVPKVFEMNMTLYLLSVAPSPSHLHNTGNNQDNLDREISCNFWACLVLSSPMPDDDGMECAKKLDFTPIWWLEISCKSHVTPALKS